MLQKIYVPLLLIVGFILSSCSQVQDEQDIVDPAAFDQKIASGYLCKPEGTGPFPGVMYNHGGSGGDQIGGDPEGACKALADAGFVGYAPIRTEGSKQENLDQLYGALDYLMSLSYVDPYHIGILGFSKGAFLTYFLAEEEKFDAVVLMATVPVDEKTASTSKITSPVLLLVAENDTPGQLNGGKDIHEGMQDLYSGLRTASVDVELKIYPPYLQDGHTMFFEIGDYWTDVIAFLEEHL